jgi:hypothetical protein
MPEELDFESWGPASELLDIAKKHLSYIKRARSGGLRVPGRAWNHALVASIFSAAAIEAALQTFIIAPILFIRDDSIRRFYATLLTRHVRLSTRDKIDFAKQFSPLLRKDKKLIQQTKELFSHRNTIVHSSLDYAEPLALRDGDILSSDIRINEHFVRKPVLYHKVTGIDPIRDAFKHFDVAHRFIQKLSPFTPNSHSDCLLRSSAICSSANHLHT